MKEAEKKRKLTAIAAAAAVILAIAGAMAYFSYANGGDGNEHVKAEIVETGITQEGGADNGTLKRDILPGTSEQRDLKVRLDADTDAFVFLIVKDTVNTNGAGLVTYAIDPGWNELGKTGLEEMNIEKSIDIFSDKASGTLTLSPQDANTKIYYRVEHGTALSHSFTYPVLKDNQISYSSALTNDDVKNIQDDNAISFQTYAIQMEPFCKATETDAAKLAAGAKDAWNQVEKVSKITVTAAGGATEVKEGQTLRMSATVEPATAKDTTYTWSVEPGTGTATISDSGILKGETAGTVTVVATANDGSGVKGTYEVTVTVSTLEPGDHVEIGGTAEGYTGTPLWRVIDIDEGNNRALLLSEYVWLGDGNNADAAFVFNARGSGKNYEGSNAQTWCSNFYDRIFSDADKGNIVGVNVVETEETRFPAGNFSPCSIDGTGDGSKNKVFFLSAYEMKQYFNNKGEGENVGEGEIVTDINGEGRYWWLRSARIENTNSAGYVTPDTPSTVRENWVYREYNARPAMYVDLDYIEANVNKNTDLRTEKAALIDELIQYKESKETGGDKEELEEALAKGIAAIESAHYSALANKAFNLGKAYIDAVPVD